MKAAEGAARRPAAGAKGDTLGSDFSRVPATARRAVIVSAPDSPLEREADRIAELVAKSPPAGPHGAHQAIEVHPAGPGPHVQRQALDEDNDIGATAEDEGEEGLGPDEDELDTDDTSEGDESGRPKVRGESGAWVGKVAIPSGGGQALASEVRRSMEGRIGYDFGHVRVHTDAGAATAAAGLDASAFTVGRDIYFAESHYAPGSPEGDELLAHELVHVAQQTGGGTGSAGLVQRRPRGPRDAPSNPGRRRKRGGKCVQPPPCKGECSGARALPKNSCRRHPFAGNETCPTSGAADSTHFIRHLDVNLTTQKVVAEMGSAKRVTGIEEFLSSPNPGITPPGMHTVGQKCGPCHTNNKCGDGMAWFTGFENGLEFGFHDSQKVATGIFSHGCVRVTSGDDRDRWIHDNTASGVTTVCVHKAGHCGRRPPAKPPPGGGGGGAPAESERPAVGQEGGESPGLEETETAIA
jgi:hypothetical protein